LVDIHSHVLYGLDDGSPTIEQSVAMVEMASRSGTAAIVATPHVLREPWINADRRDRDRLLSELNARLGGEPIVLAGCEYYFSNVAPELVEHSADIVANPGIGRVKRMRAPAVGKASLQLAEAAKAHGAQLKGGRVVRLSIEPPVKGCEPVLATPEIDEEIGEIEFRDGTVRAQIRL